MSQDKEFRRRALRGIETGELFAYRPMEVMHVSLIFIPTSFEFLHDKTLIPATIEEVQAEFLETDMQENAWAN